MRPIDTLFLITAGLLLAAAPAAGTVVHADSAEFLLDTVTGVDDLPGRGSAMTGIAAIRPNPFNPATNISYDLAEDGVFELAVYDMRGRLVAVLGSGTAAAGRHTAAWDGSDRAGRAVPSGAYCCRLTTGSATQTRKLLLAK